jgi:tRNA (guanine-N7-)-methyltransferase
MTQTDREKAGEFSSRPVRSFVKRQGRMTAGQSRALATQWPRFGIDYRASMLVLADAFGRDAPVTLEIGFGNGDNLIDMARQAPDINFLGIEVHEPGVGHCLMQIAEHQLDNVRVMKHDAMEVLRNMIADHSLARVNLFFPDPWPKKRHHKRRIVNHAFVTLLAQKMSPRGIFHVATDWDNYAEHIADVMVTVSGFEKLEQLPGDRSVSRFDRRGQRLGHANWEQAWCTCSKKS